MSEREILKLLKTEPNEVFNYYYKDVVNTCGYVSRRYNWDKEDLLSYSYFKFVECVDKFDPNYGDGKMKFVQFFIRCLQWHLPAYIRRERNINSKNMSLDCNIIEGEESSNTFYNLRLVDDSHQNFGLNKELSEYVNKLPQKYKTILIMTAQGYKQHEIGKVVGLTQTRISTILKKIRTVDIPRDNNYNYMRKHLIDVAELISYLKIDYIYDPNEKIKNAKPRKSC